MTSLTLNDVLQVLSFTMYRFSLFLMFMLTLLRYRITILCTVVISYLCLMPAPKIEVTVPAFDKWTHIALFATLCTIMWIEYWRSHHRASYRPWHLWMLILWPSAFGALIEVLQAVLTVTRSGDWLDWVADTIGVLLAAAIGKSLLRRLAKST